MERGGGFLSSWWWCNITPQGDALILPRSFSAPSLYLVRESKHDCSGENGEEHREEITRRSWANVMQQSISNKLTWRTELFKEPEDAGILNISGSSSVRTGLMIFEPVYYIERFEPGWNLDVSLENIFIRRAQLGEELSNSHQKSYQTWSSASKSSSECLRRLKATTLLLISSTKRFFFNISFSEGDNFFFPFPSLYKERPVFIKAILNNPNYAQTKLVSFIASNLLNHLFGYFSFTLVLMNLRGMRKQTALSFTGVWEIWSGRWLWGSVPVHGVVDYWQGIHRADLKVFVFPPV